MSLSLIHALVAVYCEGGRVDFVVHGRERRPSASAPAISCLAVTAPATALLPRAAMQPRRRAAWWTRDGCSLDHLVGAREHASGTVRPSPWWSWGWWRVRLLVGCGPV